jgi:hypothetical protein
MVEGSPLGRLILGTVRIKPRARGPARQRPARGPVRMKPEAQRPQTSNPGATLAARANAFSISGGGRAQSARGNQSLAAKGGNKGGVPRR